MLSLEGLLVAIKLLIAQSYAGHKRAKLSQVQGSHSDHHWISPLISNGIAALYSHADRARTDPCSQLRSRICNPGNAS